LVGLTVVFAGTAGEGAAARFEDADVADDDADAGIEGVEDSTSVSEGRRY